MRRLPFNPLQRKWEADRPALAEQYLARVTAERVLTEEDQRTIRAMLDKPLAHKVYTDSYVWCDYHGEIHEAKENPYTEDMSGDECTCAPLAWRAVFIESSDPEETF